MSDTDSHTAPNIATDNHGGDTQGTTGDMSQVRLRRPMIFGKYELLSRMRVGGMAEVYRAKETAHAEEFVAIKRILPSFTDEADYIAMFQDEGKLALQLKHPCIVESFEMGQVEDTLYIAMEYVSGLDLGTMLGRARDRAEPLPLGSRVGPPPASCRVAAPARGGLSRRALPPSHGPGSLGSSSG